MRTLTEIVEEFELNNDKNLTDEEMYIISEMATIGWFQETKPNGKPTGTKFKVFVNGGEGRIPHMHIWDDATNGKQFHTCLMLEKPRYFDHGYKKAKFTQKELNALISFLRSPEDENSDIPVWKILVRQWNRSNKNQVSLLDNMPEYEKLK